MGEVSPIASGVSVAGERRIHSDRSSLCDAFHASTAQSDDTGTAVRKRQKLRTYSSANASSSAAAMPR
ncbi:MAG: hypothetical protein LUF91_02405 [Oscillospiraceae bacterium]|nr:hypothetical protein [Oscillospiraceae bacterium]